MPEVSKEQNFDFMYFYGQKNKMADMVKLGYGYTNGFVAQKWLIFAETTILRKCRQLQGLNFRIGDWLLWKCLLLVFCQSKVKMWFFGFLDQNVLHTAQQNCKKYQHFYCSTDGRYWWQMMPEVLKKFSCHMYGHHWGPKSKVWKKWKKNSNDFFLYLDFFRY